MDVAPVIRFTGPVLVGPDDARAEMWSIGGRVSFSPPVGLPGSAATETIRGWVLPGLVDAHCHVGLGAHGAADDATSEAQAVEDRDAGALLLRDAGSPADTRWMDDREDLPRMIRAGTHIARTMRYAKGRGHQIEPAELPTYMAREAPRGDGWVKLVGDWIDRDTGDLAPSFPRDALVAGIAAAHGENARVTAHCIGEAPLRDLVEAGIDCIEHATGLTEDTIALFAEHRVAIVPTLVNMAMLGRIADSAEAKFPAYARHLRALHARRHATVAAAYEAGISIYVGTDAGTQVPHGLVAEEILELVQAGIPVTQAISAGSWGARTWLGRDGLVEGAPADVVVVDADPRADPRTLLSPTAVVLRGRVVARRDDASTGSR
jgi:imidazolonepropionase-like amidohydrolase